MLMPQYEQVITETHVIQAVELAKGDSVNITINLTTGGTDEEFDAMREQINKDLGKVLDRTKKRKIYKQKSGS